MITPFLSEVAHNKDTVKLISVKLNLDKAHQQLNAAEDTVVKLLLRQRTNMANLGIKDNCIRISADDAVILNNGTLLTKYIMLQEKEYVSKDPYKIVVETLNVVPSEMTMNASITNDLGADSLEVVELIHKYEQYFKISILDEQAETVGTVGEAVDLLYKTVEKNGKI